MDQPGSYFWNQPSAALQADLASSGEGLSQSEARQRAVRFGPNTLRSRGERSLLLQYLNHFRNPLVMILLAASAVSALTGEVTGFVVIWVIVLVSVTLDFVQEYRAGQAAEQLKQTVAVRATVIRDGHPQDVPIATLVPGDVVLLTAGDLMPADCRLIEAKDFFVNQALLTGESYPVEKHAADLAEPTGDLSQAENAVFMGTSAISGMARAMVCQIGSDTAVGSIADSLVEKAPPTAFELGTHSFGMLIMRLTVLLVLFVFLVNALFHRPFLESFLFAIALAVGLTPELLPMVVTVTLSRGALRMARQHVIVKQLAAIHNLGSMDVLCTDKTGTLTEARIHLERHLDVQGRDSAQVLQLAYLNSYFETGLKSPLDAAILEHTEIEVGHWRKIDEVPFDFERRRVSVLLDDAQQRLLVVKGAPEDILRLSTQYARGEALGTQPLDEATLATIQALHDSLEREGFKVLGIAWRSVASDCLHAGLSDETELIFAGFAAFLDPPKPSASKALKELAEIGVDVKIVTGDSELVTRHVFTQLGVPVTGVLTGNEMQQMDDTALAVQIKKANLLCRVTPAQKNRVILNLKAQGHTVGYLGDGINDAPSLHSADIGISVDSAVDVAKAAAAMILLRQDLNVLRAGVLEGRRTFANIMKYIMMGTSSNFGNMFSMAGATMFLAFLPMLPAQILLNNLLYDVSELPIPMDNVDDDFLAHPKHWDTKFIRNFMWVVGPVSSVFDFLTFFIMLKVFNAGEALFHTGWFIESIATQVLVIFIIRTQGSPFKSRPSRVLTITSLAVVLIAGALPFMPIAALFGFVAPPPQFFLILLVMLLCYLVAVEWIKQLFYRFFAAH
ncbi:magnesium-translocating P-type ATPase [Burkholderia sp. AU33545]|uniref:magnesium-translocating P-type ATPase n=1 Tax=Burkholderia sp. AU33545 TaxID=2879631 RepID=UPI001CF1FD7C|nr:magnesium-translocating P-type ATPase [Burkholderia sp. AU33545]MCA8201709.1 magnesium-translocating P-type ATPase [Burkholderia sp. AU33545]